MPAALPILPDAAARTRIVNDIADNLAVEAAAGSGKTTCLVDRLLTLARRGEIRPGSYVAAVTFTRKAAAELRERLQARIAAALLDDDSPDRENLAAAAEALENCHIGTIHSFCSRLLRERPVEAGVDPDFVELDQVADQALQERTWAEFSAAFPGGGGEALAAAFSRLDLSLSDLREGFLDFSSYPDVGVWPGEDFPLAVEGEEEALAALVEYARTVSSFIDGVDNPNVGTDNLYPAYRHLHAWAKRHGETPGREALHAILPHLPASAKTTQTCWSQFFGKDKTAVADEADRYRVFYERDIAPFLDRLRAARYGAALRCYREAAGIYARLRREARGLNFNDLLMRTAALLRDHPEARRELSNRYPRLLVDEVQDTDPIQAEIIFLLAGDDPAVADWRRCRPRPGALFMVGDPKQSIYRFTRADIATYVQIKELLRKNGGAVLQLTVNFRSQPPILDWVNRTFEPRDGGGPDRFPAEENAASPAYVSLQPGRSTAEQDCFVGVYGLEMLKKSKPTKKDPSAPTRGKEQIEADEAERIARFIHNAVFSPTPMLLPDKGGAPRPATPSDFLVATRKRAGVGVVAEALRRAGLPVRVAGVNRFEPEAPPRLLALALAAALEPDNSILQVSFLRSRLVGVSDADLYEWKQAGGGFDRLDPLPLAGPEAVRDGLQFLRRLAGFFHDYPPTTALGLMAEALGLWPMAAAADDGDSAAGAVAAILDRLSAQASDLPTPASVRERLDWILADGEFDIPPALGDTGPAVRVMNVHKTKGLEAPVVFLAGWPDERKRELGIVIDRGGETVEGRLALYRNRVMIACPLDWKDSADAEQEFLAAEKLRLGYVAATRAEAALIVSVLPQTKGLTNAMIPNPVIDERLPEDYPTPPAPAVREPSPPARDEYEREMAADAARRERLTTPSYELARAKDRHGIAFVPPPAEDAVASDWADDGMTAASGESALALGEVLHEILENPAPVDRDELRRFVLVRLSEHELPQSMSEAVMEMLEGVWRSELWRRSGSARRVFRELPFVMSAPGGDGRPALIRGVIDVAFEEEDGWVIADYKSDRPRGRSLADLAETHRGQLVAYAEALRAALPGATIKELGIYFLRAGEYVVLPVE